MRLETQSVTRAGANLEATVAGDGAVTVVLLHGYPFDRTMWDPQLRALAARTTVLAPDLRGLGSSELGDGAGDVRTHADDVVAWLARESTSRVVLMGLSMGGYVAFEVWRRARERVAALVLIDTKPTDDSADAKKARVSQREAIREGGMSAVVAPLLDAVLGSTTKASRPDVVEHVRRMILHTKPAGAMAALDAMRTRPDSTPDLAGIDVPTLVLVGEEDGITPPNVARDMAHAIPGATLVTIPAAGHVTSLEAPELVTRALRTFLDGLALDTRH